MMSEPVTDSNTLPEGAPEDPLTGHDYDGIQEYDNPLPGWWKWLLIASIVFTPPYFFFYHNGVEGRSLADRYDRNLAANMELNIPVRKSRKTLVWSTGEKSPPGSRGDRERLRALRLSRVWSNCSRGIEHRISSSRSGSSPRSVSGSRLAGLRWPGYRKICHPAA